MYPGRVSWDTGQFEPDDENCWGEGEFMSPEKMEQVLEEILKQNELRAKHTQRKLRIQDKIKKACTVIVVVSLAIIAYAVIFT